jgi:hypothetical protein
MDWYIRFSSLIKECEEHPKIVRLPVVLYEHETWSLTLREENVTLCMSELGAAENIWT